MPKQTIEKLKDNNTSQETCHLGISTQGEGLGISFDLIGVELQMARVIVNLSFYNKYHLGGLNDKHLFLTVLDAGGGR